MASAGSGKRSQAKKSDKMKAPASKRTMERVARAQAARSSRAKTMDAKQDCKVVFDAHPTEGQARAWLRNPGRYDIRGIDTREDSDHESMAETVVADGGTTKTSVPMTWDEFQLAKREWLSKRRVEERPVYIVYMDYKDPRANYYMHEGEEPIWMDWEAGRYDTIEDAMDELERLVAETADNPDYGDARITNGRLVTIWDRQNGPNADLLSEQELEAFAEYQNTHAGRKPKRRKISKYSLGGADYSESYYQAMRRRTKGDPVGFYEEMHEAGTTALGESDPNEVEWLEDVGYSDIDKRGRWKWDPRATRRAYRRAKASETEFWRLNDEMAYASHNAKTAVSIDGHPGTWREVDARSGFRLLESVEYGRALPRLVVTSDDRVVTETDGDLSDVLKNLMGPARTANGYAVAGKKPKNKCGSFRRSRA